MEACAPSLEFAMTVEIDSGELTMKLKNAKFCRVRYCPVCQWRRSLKWKGRFYDALPEIVEKQPGGEWIFLTLTQRNCSIEELHSQISEMNKAFARLVRRGEFDGVVGWMRSLEITRGDDGSAHPHFHALLLVKPSYWSHHYTTHAEWREAWQTVMRLDYEPQVKVQKIRTKKADVDRLGSKDAALGYAVAETLKYSVKPSDMLADRDWFLEMVRQTIRVRAIATGGLLKHALRENEKETEQDLLLLGDEEAPPQPEAPTLKFDYAPEVSKYRRKRGS